MPWGGTVHLTDEDRSGTKALAKANGGDLATFHHMLGSLAFARFLGTDLSGYVVRAVPPRAKYVNLNAGGDPDDAKVVLVLLLANYEKASIVGWMTAGALRAAGKDVNLSRDLRSNFPERKETPDAD